MGHLSGPVGRATLPMGWCGAETGSFCPISWLILAVLAVSPLLDGVPGLEFERHKRVLMMYGRLYNVQNT